MTPVGLYMMKFSVLLRLASQSLWYRRAAVFLTLTAVTVSVFTLLNVEHLRQATKQSFSSTVSGVDLIVGPRTSDLNLLLTTVFRIGQPSQNMSWSSYQRLVDHPNIAWTIPFGLGDSHKGFRVVGTQTSFFTHFHYGQSRGLEFTSGAAFSDVFDVVLGASVAQQLGYGTGDTLTLSHGIARTSFHNHESHPFHVSGILKATGTPVDNALYVSLSGLEAVHLPQESYPGEFSAVGLNPKAISAAMVGLTSKLVTFKVQREINSGTAEPLTAILPGVALTELWAMSRGVESALSLMAQCILLGALFGLGAVMIATLRERSHELAVLRTLGAGPAFIFTLLLCECVLVGLVGITLGAAAFTLSVFIASGYVAEQYGIHIGLSQVTAAHGLIVLSILGGVIVSSAIPALLGLTKVRNL